MWYFGFINVLSTFKSLQFQKYITFLISITPLKIISCHLFPGTGDKDAQDAASMRKSDVLRSDRSSESAFFRPSSQPSKRGQFEKFTRGIGRKLLEGQGWQDGQGLGKKKQGRPDVVDDKGQQGRSGLGFSARKTPESVKNGQNANPPWFHKFSKRRRGKEEVDTEEETEMIRISTIYD